MGKWLAGIASAVIIGVVVWWLTSSGGPLNPVEPPTPSPTPTPLVLITKFEVGTVFIPPDSVIDASFTVYNEGDATAKECSLWWHSHGADFAPSGTQAFSLRPQETRDLSVQSFIYDEPGTYDSFAYVRCSNFRSEDIHRDVAVIRNP
jgi:hypothetical protein